MSFQYRGLKGEYEKHVVTEMEVEHRVLESLARDKAGDEHTDGGKEHQHGGEGGIDGEFVNSKRCSIATEHAGPDEQHGPGIGQAEGNEEKQPYAASLEVVFFFHNQ